LVATTQDTWCMYIVFKVLLNPSGLADQQLSFSTGLGCSAQRRIIRARQQRHTLICAPGTHTHYRPPISKPPPLLILEWILHSKLRRAATWTRMCLKPMWNYCSEVSCPLVDHAKLALQLEKMIWTELDAISIMAKRLQRGSLQLSAAFRSFRPDPAEQQTLTAAVVGSKAEATTSNGRVYNAPPPHFQSLISQRWYLIMAKLC